MTVGFYGGKFLIPHMGHVYAMTMASAMVDELHIMVMHDEETEKETFHGTTVEPISFRQRVRWWSEITKDMPHVHVHAVYEKNDNRFESWQQGAEGIKSAIGKPIDKVFSSESAYGIYFERLYPDATHVVIDEKREKYPISATQIREEGVYAHWDMLPPPVRRSFVKKVVIVGTESAGKSTIVRNLARLYNTNFVEEHGRTFYEELGGCEELTMKEDYAQIAYRHKYHEYEAAKQANKVLFIDTEALVTHYYSKLYVGETQSVLDAIANEQHYDLWLFLEPDVKWVDDGTRSFGEQQVREQNNELLKQMLFKQGISYTSIKGNYEERLKQTMKSVDDLLRPIVLI